MGHRRASTAAIKLQAVQVAEQCDVTLTSVARDLGALESLLRKRRVHDDRARDMAAFPGSGPQRLTAQQEEIKRLRRENEILRQEREILKKAAAQGAKQAR